MILKDNIEKEIHRVENMQAVPAARLPAIGTARSESAPSVYDCEKQVEEADYELQLALDNDNHETAAWYQDTLKAAEAKLNPMRLKHSWYGTSKTTRQPAVEVVTAPDNDNGQN